MGSKIFLLLGLSIAFVVFISSEVSARDLAETTTKTDGYNGSGGYSGGGHYNGGNNHKKGKGGHYNGGGCYHGYCQNESGCCKSAAQALENAQVKKQN